MPTPLTAADLLAVPLFSHLSTQGADALLVGQLPLVAAAEQALLIQQDEGAGLLLIREGLAKVRAFSADGEEVILAVCGPGDLLGEMAVLSEGARTADVVALTPLLGVKLRAVPYRELLFSDGRLALALAGLLLSRLQASNRRLLLRGADATTRLLAVLHELALLCSRQRDPLAWIPLLPQRELAAMAGLSRETTSRSLARLRQRGLVISEASGLRLADLQPLRQRGLL